jgi:hypothetical protein
MFLGIDKIYYWHSFGKFVNKLTLKGVHMSIERKEITEVLPVGILSDGVFTPDDGGLAVRMSGFYTVGELKAIVEDLIYVDAKYRALQLLKAKY